MDNELVLNGGGGGGADLGGFAVGDVLVLLVLNGDDMARVRLVEQELVLLGRAGSAGKGCLNLRDEGL